jgi:hypothetical protein
MGEQGEQEGAEHTSLWSLRVEDQCSVGVVAYLHHLESALKEVQDPVAQDRAQTQGPELSDELFCLYTSMFPVTLPRLNVFQFYMSFNCHSVNNIFYEGDVFPTRVSSSLAP